MLLHPMIDENCLTGMFCALFDRHTVFGNGSLYFPRVRKSDEAGYRCEGLSSLTDIPAQTFTSELIIACKYLCVFVNVLKYCDQSVLNGIDQFVFGN